MPRIVEKASFFALLVLAAVRPLIPESYDSAGSGLTAALRGIDDPKPLATLIFDLIILLTACGWFLSRRWLPSARYRRTGLEWGVAILSLAAIVSCAVAGNKRLAINAALDWLCYPIFAIVLVQLLQDHWRRRLLLAVMLASACAQAVKCFDDHLLFDDIVASYEAAKEEGFWERQGVEPGAAKITLFENRMKAREASGFFPHSNVAGSYFVLCALGGIGALLGRRRSGLAWRDGVRWAGGVACVLAIVVAAAMTRSKGALIAGAVGLAWWAVASRCRRRIDAHRRRAVFVGWLCVLAGGAAVIGYGLAYGSLPGASLDFRWQYWRASSRLIADHALTGVGRENFGRHYVQYKSIETPEEISNPHNLLVQAAADWGILGLVGIVAMLIGGSLAVCAPTSPSVDRRHSRADREHPHDGTEGETPRGLKPAARAESASTHDGGTGGSTMLWAVAVGAAVFAVRIPLSGTDDIHYLYYTTMTLGIAWACGLWCFAANAKTSVHGAAGTGLAIGVFAFLLHEMINFAAFVPGAATTLFAALAYCIAERPGADRSMPRRTATVVAGLFAVSVLAAVSWALIPVARASHALDVARSMQILGLGGWPGPPGIDAYLQRAVRVAPWDPTPCAARAKFWVETAGAMPELRAQAWSTAQTAIAKAVERDPHYVGYARMQARVLFGKARFTGAPVDYHAALAAARRAVELYPEDPEGHTVLAEYAISAAVALAQVDLAQEAHRHYRRALELDDARPEWERIRGMTQRRRAKIEAELRRIERFIKGLPG